MGYSTSAGRTLHHLVRIVIPLCQQAAHACPRTGPGRPPEIPDWVLLVLVTIALLKHRHNKSAQYRFLSQHRTELMRWIGTRRFPSRSTYCDRYRRASRLFQVAIRVQGRSLLRSGLGDARCVVVDKSLLRALGPPWSKRQRRSGKIPAGADRDSTWSYSQHHGWVQGYSYEVLISAGKRGIVVPLMASADAANRSEHRSFAEKIAHLPAETKYVLADSGYDANQHAERIERDDSGHRTGRRFLCPQVYRRGEHRRPEQACPDRHVARRLSRSRREARACYFRTPQARRIYSRRNRTVEPFHDWFKSAFELHERVWHRGLDNNRTMILGAIFAYQALLRYNRRCGHIDGQVQWILDAL